MSTEFAQWMSFTEGGAPELAGGLTFARPSVLFALAIPLLLLLFAKLLARPDRLATGSLRLWMRIQARGGAAARAKRPGVPLPLWLLAGSLAFALLALAGPRNQEFPPGRLWRVVVDRSPSMDLRMLPERNPDELMFLAESYSQYRDSPAGCFLRVAGRSSIALDAALGELSRNWQRGDRVQYSSPGRETLELTDSIAPPIHWFGSHGFESEEPDWESNDTPGTLFVTDRARPVQFASLFASGGDAVIGLVGRNKQKQIRWVGGDELVESEDLPRVAFCVGEGVVAQFFESWCSARGFKFTREASAERESALSLYLPSAATSGEELLVGRDGWTLSVREGEARSSVPPSWETQEVWLREGDLDLVTLSPGCVEVNWSSFDEEEWAAPGGDPAAFAVSWAMLFDRAVAPEPGVVSLKERQSAGEPVIKLGEPPVEIEFASEPSRYDVWLTWLAAGFAAAAAWSLLGRTSSATFRSA